MSHNITVKKIPIFGKEIDVNCFNKNCIDEWFGLVAIIIGITAMLWQFIKTGKSEDVSSFSIGALSLVVISEGFFAAQGIIKKSWTIGITRTITCLTFLSFLILISSIHHKKKKKKKKKDDDKEKFKILKS